MKSLRTKKRLVMLAVVMTLLLVVVPVAQAWPFGDVPVGYWAYNAIRRISYLNITGGCGGGNYCPEAYVTRAQMAGFLNNLTKANTNMNEPYIFSVSNNNNGAGQSGSGIIAKSYINYGLQGRSTKGVGVLGVHEDTGNYAEMGRANYAVHAVAFSGVGVRAEAPTNDGVWGRSGAANKSGVYGQGTGAAFNYGVFGVSDSGIGVQGTDGGAYPDDSYGVKSQGDIWGTDDLYLNDRLNVTGYATFSGGKSGFVVDVAQNVDEVALEQGDVVVISGAGPAVLGEIPLILVRRATAEDASAVVGVVDRHYIPVAKTSVTTTAEGNVEKVESVFEEAAIAPGEYLSVVTLGSYQAIKVDASYGAIAPGDLLVASPNPGHAMAATAPEAGTIVGKALEAFESGTGVIAVVITLQ